MGDVLQRDVLALIVYVAFGTWLAMVQWFFFMRCKSQGWVSIRLSGCAVNFLPFASSVFRLPSSVQRFTVARLIIKARGFSFDGRATLLSVLSLPSSV